MTTPEELRALNDTLDWAREQMVKLVAIPAEQMPDTTQASLRWEFMARAAALKGRKP